MTIRFLADECFSGALVRALRGAGYDVQRSSESIAGAPDPEVLALAFEQDRILITEDNDFGELVVRFKLPTHGVVRVDLKSLDKPGQVKALLGAVDEVGERLRDSLVTVEPHRTRQRPILR